MGIDLAAPYYEVRAIADPAPGSDFTITVPGDRAWRILSLAFQLVTDANAASRALFLQADDGGNPFFLSAPGTGHAASTTRRFGTMVGASIPAGAEVYQPLLWPDGGLFMRPGWRLRTSTTNIQVGDQFSLITFSVISYPNPDGKGWLPSPPYFTSY